MQQPTRGTHVHITGAKGSSTHLQGSCVLYSALLVLPTKSTWFFCNQPRDRGAGRSGLAVAAAVPSFTSSWLSRRLRRPLLKTLSPCAPRLYIGSCEGGHKPATRMRCRPPARNGLESRQQRVQYRWQAQAPAEQCAASPHRPPCASPLSTPRGIPTDGIATKAISIHMHAHR